MNTRRSLLGLGFFSLIVAVAATQACGGTSDGTAPGGSTPEAGTGDETGTTGTTDQDAASAADAGEDGETIADGGSNIDPDAGDDDAGLDAGPCNALANTAPAITSTCVSFAPVLGGGTLVAGTYFLTHVAALATPAFCQNNFVPTGLKETLSLTVDATGVSTAETVTTIGGGATRHRTSTLTPSAGDKSPLQATATCPAGATTAVPYVTSIVNGKQQLVMRLPYGSKADALYRFEKQ